MNNEEVLIITRYIATWSWQFIALLFLVSSAILFALPRTLITMSLYVGFFILFVGCEFMAFKRSKEVYEYDDDEE